MVDLRPIVAGWDLDFFESYLKITGEAFKKELAAHEATIEQRLANEEEEHRVWVQETYFMHSDHLRQGFPTLLVNSTFVALFSFLEDRMVSLCEQMKDRQKHDIRFKDIQGQTFEQCKTYLSKVCRIAVPTNTPEWQSILLFQKIRNVITHRRAKMPKKTGDPKEQNFREYFETHPELIDEELAIALNEKFFLDATKVVRTFLEALYAAARHAVKEMKE